MSDGSDGTSCFSDGDLDGEAGEGTSKILLTPTRQFGGKRLGSNGPGSPGSTKGSPYRTMGVKKKVKDKSMKYCKLCRKKVTDMDEAFNDGKTTILWAEKNLKGRNCRYCRKVW